MQTFIFEHGTLINKFMNELYYSSYKTQRDEGMSHENTVLIGLGNSQFLERYIAEQTLTLN